MSHLVISSSFKISLLLLNSFLGENKAILFPLSEMILFIVFPEIDVGLALFILSSATTSAVT